MSTVHYPLSTVHCPLSTVPISRINVNCQLFNKEVQEALEEIGNELKLIAELEGNNFSFNQQGSGNFNRDLLRIIGSILGVAAAIITFFVPPVGLAMAIASSVFGGLAGLFKSKDEKRREAVHNISTSLETQLNIQKQKTIQQAKDEFDKNCNSIATNINTYFEELIAGLEAIATQLETGKTKLSNTANYLNRAYAKRVIDWCNEQYEPLTDEAINRTIAKVKRDFGRSMSIQTKSEFQLRKSQEELNRVLQEDISFNLSNIKA